MNSAPYYRKKGKSIVIEQKQDGKSVHIKTLPKPEKFLRDYFPEASEKLKEFTQKKNSKSVQKNKASDNGGAVYS